MVIAIRANYGFSGLIHSPFITCHGMLKSLDAPFSHVHTVLQLMNPFNSSVHEVSSVHQQWKFCLLVDFSVSKIICVYEKLATTWSSYNGHFSALWKSFLPHEFGFMMSASWLQIVIVYMESDTWSIYNCRCYCCFTSVIPMQPLYYYETPWDG